jgi:tripartite-type tricarboxylate transporter receptor subunit TctC
MKKYRLKRLHWIVTVLAGIAVCNAAVAQSNYPDKPVRIVVPFASGGSTDSIARNTADWLTRKIGAPFVVENRPGAGGAIAASYVAGAQPDGYLLFLATTPQMSVLPNMTKTPFDPVKDFAPISIVASNAFILAVNDAIPARALPQFVEYVKARPGRLAYASAGSGSIIHLSMALLLHRAGLDMVHVTYKGGAPAVADVVAGQLPVVFGLPSDVLPHVKSGKLRALAVSSPQRLLALPEVLTVAEQGFSRFKTVTWNGLVAPANTPVPVIKRIAAEIAAAVGDKDFVNRLQNIGVEPVGNSPAEFARVIRDDLQSWAEPVRLSGARME